MSLLDWLNSMGLERRVLRLAEDLDDFYLYGELMKKLEIVDEEDEQKYWRVKYKKGMKKQNYENTIRVLQQKMKIDIKPMYEHPDHEGILKFIQANLKEYLKREKKKRDSRNMKMGNKYGDGLQTTDKRLQHSYYSDYSQVDSRSEKIQRQEKKIDRFREHKVELEEQLK